MHVSAPGLCTLSNPWPTRPPDTTLHPAHDTTLLQQLRDYRPGSSRADLEEGRAAAREKQGLEPDSDEVRVCRECLMLGWVGCL